MSITAILRAGVALPVLATITTTGAWAQASNDRTAQGTVEQSAPGEIIVTAQKRAQGVNSVPISVTAATGEALMQRGITSTSDLAKIVPGLTAQPSPFNTPVYTLRGIGFYDSTLAAPPTVAVYTDEVPLPYSAMTKAAALDVARVEVLKGPQGTLFGQNTTGGAINYVAARPTDSFSAGMDASFGRFSTFDVQGFVSGPIASNMRARLSLRTIQGGDWQKSFTRHDSLGAQHMTQGRLLLDWDVSDKLSVTVNVNGWKDTSENQAPQRWKGYISAPTASPERQALSINYPLVPRGARWADWGTDLATPKRDDYFVQGSLRMDYAMSDTVKITSITAYERYKTDSYQEYDGTTLRIADVFSTGHINTFSQELRLAGETDRLNWVIGGNYQADNTYDLLTYRSADSTTTDQGPFSWDATRFYADQRVRTASVFGNAEFEVAPGLRLTGGMRYTDSRRKFVGCSEDTRDTMPDITSAGPFFNAVFGVSIPPGGCFTLGPNFMTYPDGIHDKLNEDNLSWKAGVNYKTDTGLLYASVSRGYKAGSFPNTAAADAKQFLPVKQETVLAYEVGFKQSLADRKLQVNGAAFYYDYKDKQLRGRIKDPLFGPLDALVQIPKSRVWGAELQLDARPVDGLTLSAAGTYLNTKIKEFVGYDASGTLADYAGSRFPYAPKWSLVGDTQYEWGLSDSLAAYVGASALYNSSTNGSVGEVSELGIKSYATLDLRAGIKSPEGKWRAEVWGRNITNSYYWTNATQTQDGFLRYAARPVTYGVSLSYRFD